MNKHTVIARSPPFDRLRACPILDTGVNGTNRLKVGSTYSAHGELVEPRGNLNHFMEFSEFTLT